MFTDLVSTLTLDKTRIIYPNFATNNLDIRKIMVKDLFKSWDTKGNNTYPDFYIRGYYYNEDHHSRNIFRIDDTGTHYLYITGVPKGTPKNSNALNVFKLLNAQYMTYFEDSEIGYLIQITQIWKKWSLLKLIYAQIMANDNNGIYPHNLYERRGPKFNPNYTVKDKDSMRQEREFNINGIKVMAYSRKDALQRLKHKNKRK